MTRFELKDDEHYATLVEVIKDRPPGVPLLTVANHTSPLDDPGVLVGMLPAWLCARPHLMRWTLCAQEICFKMTAAEVAFGSAKVCSVLLQQLCKGQDRCACEAFTMDSGRLSDVVPGRHFA